MTALLIVAECFATFLTFIACLVFIHLLKKWTSRAGQFCLTLSKIILNQQKLEKKTVSKIKLLQNKKPFTSSLSTSLPSSLNAQNLHDSPAYSTPNSIHSSPAYSTTNSKLQPSWDMLKLPPILVTSSDPHSNHCVNLKPMLNHSLKKVIPGIVNALLLQHGPLHVLSENALVNLILTSSNPPQLDSIRFQHARLCNHESDMRAHVDFLVPGVKLQVVNGSAYEVGPLGIQTFMNVNLSIDPVTSNIQALHFTLDHLKLITDNHPSLAMFFNLFNSVIETAINHTFEEYAQSLTF